MSTLSVSVWRGQESGQYQDFEVPRLESQTVLDVVSYIQRAIDPTLAYRYACRVGMCGSCAMTVNGRARWTCRTHVDKVARDGRLEIAPLANLPVVRDLVTDMSPFFDKWARAQGAFRGGATRKDDFARVPPGSPARRLADEIGLLVAASVAGCGCGLGGCGLGGCGRLGGRSRCGGLLRERRAEPHGEAQHQRGCEGRTLQHIPGFTRSGALRSDRGWRRGWPAPGRR